MSSWRVRMYNEWSSEETAQVKQDVDEAIEIVKDW